jgi:hypothetical protein
LWWLSRKLIAMVVVEVGGAGKKLIGKRNKTINRQAEKGFYMCDLLPFFFVKFPGVRLNITNSKVLYCIYIVMLYNN